jgi:DNA primase
LAFDGDKAGLAATERAIPIAQETGVDLTIISLPGDAKDPDELIQQDPALWQQAIDVAEPVIDWVLGQYSAREDTTTAAGKRSFTTAALNVIGSLKDDVEKEHYIQKIAAMINTSTDALKSKLAGMNEAASMDAPMRQVVTTRSELTPDEAAYQDNVLAVALVDGATHELFAHIDPTMFVGEERQAVVDYLIKHGGKPVSDIPKELQKYDTYVKIVLLKADARYADWNDQDRYFETARLLRQVATKHKEKQKDILTEQLREAETVGDETKATEMRAKLNTLIKEINSGKR